MNLNRQGLILLAITMSTAPVTAQINTNSQPASYQSNVTITGLQEGPYNIGVRVQPVVQPVPLANVGKPTKPAPQTASTNISPSQPQTPSSPVNLGTLFPNLFGSGDESHHHGPDGKDVPPFLSLPSLAPLNGHTPSIDFPYLPDLGPRYDDSDYQCYNYVFEQLTGVRSSRALNADDVTNLLNSFTTQSYKPGTRLPENYPPGTVLLLDGHVGIVGTDGHTIFNYTKKSPNNNIPATLHRSPSANALWNHTDPPPQPSQPTNLGEPGFLESLVGPAEPPVQATTDNQPYAGDPVQVFTPPQK